MCNILNKLLVRQLWDRLIRRLLMSPFQSSELLMISTVRARNLPRWWRAGARRRLGAAADAAVRLPTGQPVLRCHKQQPDNMWSMSDSKKAWLLKAERTAGPARFRSGVRAIGGRSIPRGRLRAHNVARHKSVMESIRGRWRWLIFCDWSAKGPSGAAPLRKCGW